MTKTNRYSFNVFWSDEDEAHVATCVEFPGISAFADSIEQAFAELRIALDLAIETYEAEGWQLPEPVAKAETRYSGQFRVRLPKSLHAQLAARAKREGVSLNTLVVSHLSSVNE